MTASDSIWRLSLPEPQVHPRSWTELSYADIGAFFVCFAHFARFARWAGIQHAGGPLQAAKSRWLSRMLKRLRNWSGKSPSQVLAVPRVKRAASFIRERSVLYVGKGKGNISWGVGCFE